MSGQAPPPRVAIGGVGGSGTNLIAALAQALGVHIGSDINDSQDNLAWTLMFKRRGVLAMEATALAADLDLFARAMTRSRPIAAHERDRLLELAAEARPQHAPDWLAERARRLIAGEGQGPGSGPWGWKEPNTHLLLPALARQFPALRYVHVVRHGLDMAFSSNQNQLEFWGDAFAVPADLPAPRRALQYWLAVQRRARELGAGIGSRFLWLDYDAFCADPVGGIERLAHFLELPATDLERLAPMVKPQASHGRYRHSDCSMFSPEELEAVRELGFPVTL